ncbi:MAG: hypothetical protein JSV96_16200 [Candidatus Aminicenantes bacterium]|nr:MAG: hypothetical protein JSV96_16200 [Candidatus Aminicenantes bacterium]
MIMGCLILFLVNSASSQTLELKGLLSGWVTVNTQDISKPQFGLYYIPEFSIKKSLTQNYSIDFDLSLNVNGTARLRPQEGTQTSGEIRLYRMWGRFSSSQFEARLGLQKINFGSASLLRPLMWFDRIDPRDPLKLTDGVYGILLRYYFLNNANIWIWGLYGNKNTKGWEFLSTRARSVEFGGRFQHPVGKGELALTYHHRQIDPNQSLFGLDKANVSSVPEDRFALDGKWDIGIGFWFEGALTHQSSELLPHPWQKAVTVGFDYTFGLGSGLILTGEYFVYTSSQEVLGSGDSMKFSALSMNYPLGILDNLSCIFYYDWKNENLYSFLNWRRTYDQWIINVIGFWNPKLFQIYQNPAENGIFAGKGIQIMVIFNH